MIVILALPSIPGKIHQLFEDHGIVVKVEKGSYIFREGERAENLFIVVSGVVQICKETESGKELTIRICGKDSIIGESILYYKLNCHSTTAKTLENCTLIGLNIDSLEMLLNENPSTLVEYLKWVQVENLKHQTRIRDLILNGKKGALFSTLIRLANTYGEYKSEKEIFINLSLTNTDIANLCGTSREMINRMLNDLKKNHIISFDKGFITILDIQFLKNEIDCENCPLAICRLD